MRELGKILLTITASLFVFFFFTEVAVRIYTAFFIFYDVEMSRYANELKIPADNPKIGHLHRPGARAHLMGVDVEINSDGFRDDYYPVARSDRRRLIFLGDSLTFAWGVAKQDAFEVLLEEKLGRQRLTEVINFGHGNYNTVQQVNLFVEKGLKYKPDGVVVFFFINDAEPTPVRSSWGFLNHSRVITFFWSRINAALTNLSSSKSYAEFYSELYADAQPGWVEAQQAFLELRDLCRKRSIGLKVVLLPELHSLVRYPLADEHAKVQRFLQQAGIESLDLAPRFADQENPHALWVALDDAHPNADAHRLIAEYSYDFISDSGGG